MRQMGGFAVATLVSALLMLGGCATKGYVKATEEPINTKVTQVDQKVDKETSDRTGDIQKVNQGLAENSRAIDATNEVAKTADGEAKGAMAKATQDANDISSLKSVVASIDDYNAGDHVVLLFPVNKSTLSAQDKQQLDDLASKVGNTKRYFITIEGFTDQTGSATYNDRLSRERADAVSSYLVGSHDIPTYRIHVIGLGKQKLVDNGHTRQDREQSRRAEITIYTAKPLS